jgi:DNA-binding transcriptional MerR regulator
MRPDATPVTAEPGRAETGRLLGIGAAAAQAGVSERALRYYQQLGLITPCSSRVARIRQLQVLLGLNLDEIAVVLRNEDRMAQIKRTYLHEHTSDAERRELVRESLQLQHDLRATVEAKRVAIEGFLADLDARIARSSDLLDQMTAPVP